MDIQSLMQVSIRRNELIADLFARIDKTERLGSGLRRVFAIMEKVKLASPVITSNLFFRISFKRPFYSDPKEAVSSEKMLDATPEKILKEVENNPHITIKQLAAITGVTLRAIEKQMAALQSSGLISRSGSRKTGKWMVNRSSV